MTGHTYSLAQFVPMNGSALPALVSRNNATYPQNDTTRKKKVSQRPDDHSFMAHRGQAVHEAACEVSDPRKTLNDHR